ncbi:hypothetical protein D9M71_190400 [compost metagenome]
MVVAATVLHAIAAADLALAQQSARTLEICRAILRVNPLHQVGTQALLPAPTQQWLQAGAEKVRPQRA